MILSVSICVDNQDNFPVFLGPALQTERLNILTRAGYGVIMESNPVVDLEIAKARTNDLVKFRFTGAVIPC